MSVSDRRPHLQTQNLNHGGHGGTQGNTGENDTFSVILCVACGYALYRTELSHYDIYQLLRHDDDLYHLFTSNRRSPLLISECCLFNLILVSAC